MRPVIVSRFRVPRSASFASMLMALPFLVLASCSDAPVEPAIVPAAELMDGPRHDVAGASAPTDLFISEYIEGSSNNKAIELYNGTASPIDLATGSYVVQMFFNGSATAGLTINLTGTVPAGGTFVLAQSTANATILSKANQTSSASWFNGDDAVVLRKGGATGTIVDVIGQIGFDPGSEWGTGLTSTADNTVRRKTSICQGDINGSNAFDPSVEWDGFAQDAVDGLGTHSVSCTPISVPPTVTAVTPGNNATEVPVNTNVTVAFSNPVTVTGAWFTISCSASGARAAVVTGGPSAFTLDVDNDLSGGESCTVTINASNVAAAGVSMAANYTWSFTTAAANGCDAPFTPAYSIQGSGLASPLAGSSVTTKGVVVGDFEGASPALRGFYLQDVVGDGDLATSDAVFVFNGDNNSVSVGDVVRVTGAVSEFQDQTQVTPTQIVACGTASVAPVDVTLPAASATDLERFEGMLVRFPQALTVTEHFQLGRFGQVVLSSGGRLAQPTNVVAPGAAAIALQAQNDLRRIILDDALQSQNVDPIVFGRSGNALSASNTLRGGDEVSNVTGVLTYTWAGNAASGNAYRVRPVGALGAGLPMFVTSNPRPTTVTVGGTLRVAGLNVLNYFNTFSGCTNGAGGPSTDCRGADNATEFTRQRDKIIAAILSLGADVVGVNEIENDGYGSSSAIQDLVNGLNAATAPGTWSFINADAGTGEVNALGTDAIKVGLLYRIGTVTPVGRTASLNTTAFVNGGDASPRSRPALAQAFEQPNRARVVVVVNHLKSKGSACAAADAGDGQGNCNVVRTNAAQRLSEWLATDPTDIGESRTLIMGDLNSYAKEDPITVLLNAGYVNLADSFLGAGSYSYVFDGQWGSLDHALGSPSIAAQVAGVVKHHINADEPSVLDYNTNFKTAGLIASLYAPDQYRSADHDPVVVGLNLVAPSVGPYTWGGFLTPTRTLPTLTTAAAGFTANVRFSLGGNMGLGILKVGNPLMRLVNCTTLAPLGSLASTTAVAPLAYVASTASYSYFWRTDRTWAGSCRELVLRFIDGSQQRAVYRFQ
jgi:predicted extracellular nuclease